MNNTHPIDMQAQSYDPYEDEIELMDYLKVLWKYKKFGVSLRLRPFQGSRLWIYDAT